MEYTGIQQDGDQTVQVRVQVIDLQAFTLDLQVPTYLPARDLTQRIARDAGLDAHWTTGQRRLYWLRARGRLLQDNETLRELGVIPGELVYLLPEPPHGSGVVEQNPDYPETHDYAGSGMLALLGTLILIMLWAVGWGVLLTVDRSIWSVIFPGAGLGLLCCNFARHAWGGSGSHPRIAFTGLVLFWMLFALTFALGWGLDQINVFVVPVESQVSTVQGAFRDLAPGLITGMTGVFVAWLAWWGAVESLPETPKQAPAPEQEAVTLASCGICGGGVAADVHFGCPHACGKAFHVGCYRARAAVYQGDKRFCAICSAHVA